MANQDNSFKPSGVAQDSGADCEEITNPPINRWVIWDQANQDWDVSDSASPTHGKKKPIMLPDESGGHEIRFHLRVPGGSGWQFNTVDPIWTEDNVSCGNLSGLNSDQISVPDCQALLLTIWDKNDGDARLVRYQLNFVDNGGGPVPPACDPAILNGGGGRI